MYHLLLMRTPPPPLWKLDQEVLCQCRHHQGYHGRTHSPNSGAILCDHEVLHRAGTHWLSSFEFVRSLLENQIENIKQTGGSDHVIMYQALNEQLGTNSKDLKNLERVSPLADTQRVAEDFRINQE